MCVCVWRVTSFSCTALGSGLLCSIGGVQCGQARTARAHRKPPLQALILPLWRAVNRTRWLGGATNQRLSCLIRPRSCLLNPTSSSSLPSLCLSHPCTRQASLVDTTACARKRLVSRALRCGTLMRCTRRRTGSSASTASSQDPCDRNSTISYWRSIALGDFKFSLLLQP